MKSALACLIALIVGFGALARGDGDKEKMTMKRNTCPAFDTLKKMAGTWTSNGPDGKPHDTQYKLTAGGTVLHETLMPGTPMEMVSLYHMDGKDLVMTHYCMMGNQPRLKADDPSETKKMSFKSVGGTNMTLNEQHMGRATFTFVDDDHVDVEWCSCDGGKPDEAHKMSIKMTRKK